MPSPMSAKPIRAVVCERSATTISPPPAATRAPSRTVVTGPKRATARSPVRRALAIAKANAPYAVAAVPAEDPISLRR